MSGGAPTVVLGRVAIGVSQACLWKRDRAIVALERVGKDKVVGHDALERFTIAPDQSFDPLVIHLTQLLLGIDCRLMLSLCAVHSRILPGI